jgi:hypothetical protein
MVKKRDHHALLYRLYEKYDKIINIQTTTYSGK